MITFRSPTMADCYNLAANLRDSDRDEMLAARGGITPGDLWGALRDRWDGKAAFAEDGKLICIFAVNPHPTEGVGVPWLLGTPLLDRYMISVCSHARDVLKLWHKKFHTLTNFTDIRNRRILNWLRWLGFRFGDTVALNGCIFINFSSSV